MKSTICIAYWVIVLALINTIGMMFISAEFRLSSIITGATMGLIGALIQLLLFNKKKKALNKIDNLLVGVISSVIYLVFTSPIQLNSLTSLYVFLFVWFVHSIFFWGFSMLVNYRVLKLT